MKNLRSLFFGLTVLAMATAAQAQSQTTVKANIPFDFTVGNRAYPAGEYSVKSIGSSDKTLRIDNTQEGTAEIILSNTCVKNAPAAKTMFVFHRVGNNYFLSQIWTEGNTTGREFPLSRSEVQIAQNREKSELVIVAANISH
jgi:hypothetical protein